MDGVVEQVPGLPHHEHTKIGYFDEGDQEFKNVRHPSMDLKSETESRKLACARVLIAPQSFSGGGLVFKVEIGYYGACMMGYYGACMMGYYGACMMGYY